MMSQYMLLLYATEVEGEELAEREAEIPIFVELRRSLEEAGLLVTAGRLHPTTTATTVSAVSGERNPTDGPFAIPRRRSQATTWSRPRTSTRPWAWPSGFR